MGPWIKDIGEDREPKLFQVAAGWSRLEKGTRKNWAGFAGISPLGRVAVAEIAGILRIFIDSKWNPISTCVKRSQCGNHVAMLMPRQAALALADIAEATFVYPCCLLDVLRITENHRLPWCQVAGNHQDLLEVRSSEHPGKKKLEPAFWPYFMLASQSLSCLFIKYFQKLM